MNKFIISFLLSLAFGLMLIAVWRLENENKEIKNILESASSGMDILENEYPLFKGAKQTTVLKKIDSYDVEIDLIIIDAQKLEKGIGLSSPQIFENKNYTGLSLQEYARLGDYKIVQSGGFLSSWTPPYPLGYVKIRNKIYNRVHDTWVTEGVFCTDGREFEIFSYKSENQFEKWPSCIQAGPLISIDGEIVLQTTRNTGLITKKRHRQSFVCKTYEDDLILGIAENVKLTSLSKHLVLPKNIGGIGCSDTTLLTSKGVSGIYNKENDISIGNVKVPFPNVIVVK